jgi:hypothetical protein
VPLLTLETDLIERVVSLDIHQRDAGLVNPVSAMNNGPSRKPVREQSVR